MSKVRIRCGELWLFSVIRNATDTYGLLYRPDEEPKCRCIRGPSIQCARIRLLRMPTDGASSAAWYLRVTEGRLSEVRFSVGCATQIWIAPSEHSAGMEDNTGRPSNPHCIQKIASMPRTDAAEPW